MSDGLVIVGAGDHGRVMLELLRAAGETPAGFVEPQRGGGEVGRMVDGLAVLGDLDLDVAWRSAGVQRFVVALGDNLARRDAFERCVALGLTPVAAVHPTAIMLTGARIEPGAMVCAAAVIGMASVVGKNALVNTAASIDHDNRIEAHASVAPGARLAGRVTIGEGAQVGIGASVREGIHIGEWALVAGGAMVIADVPARARVAGVPARPMADPAPG